MKNIKKNFFKTFLFISFFVFYNTQAQQISFDNHITVSSGNDGFGRPRIVLVNDDSKAPHQASWSGRRRSRRLLLTQVRLEERRGECGRGERARHVQPELFRPRHEHLG